MKQRIAMADEKGSSGVMMKVVGGIIGIVTAVAVPVAVKMLTKDTPAPPAAPQVQHDPGRPMDEPDRALRPVWLFRRRLHRSHVWAPIVTGFSPGGCATVAPMPPAPEPGEKLPIELPPLPSRMRPSASGASTSS